MATPRFRSLPLLLLLASFLQTAVPAMAAPPVNDAFASSIDLGVLATVTRTGTTAEATREANEPIYVYSNQSIWYKWTAPASGWKRLTITSTETTIANQPAVAVLEGASLESLTAFGTDPPGGSVIRFNAVAAKVYWFHVTELNAAGTFSLVLANGAAPAAPANDNFSAATGMTAALPLTVTGTFADATVELREPHAYQSDGRATVWYRWTAPAGTSWVDVYLDSAAVTSFRVYTGSTLATLVELPPRFLDGFYPEAFYQFTPGTVYYFQLAQEGRADQSLSLNLRTLATPAPAAHNNFTSRLSLGSAANVNRTAETSEEATTETGEPLPVPNLTGTMWYSWTAPATGAVLIKTTGSANHDTCLCAYTGTSLATLSLLAYNDDIDYDNGNYDSSVIVPVTAGATYQIQVGSAYAARDIFALAITPVDPDLLPFRITAFTVSSSSPNLTAAGATVTFDVTLSDPLEFESDLALNLELPAAIPSWGGYQPQRVLAGSSPPVLVSGLTYRFTRVLPAGLPPGTYPILVDAYFQSSGYADGIPAYGGKGGTLLPGATTALTITNSGAVISAPSLTSFTMTPATADTTAADVTVQISASATGLPAGYPIRLLLTDSLGSEAFFNPRLLTHNGTAWTGSITLKKGTPPGLYRPTLTLEGASLGRDYGFANPQADPLPGGSTSLLTVTNSTPDRLPPQLRDFTIDLNPVNLHAGDAVITGTCRLTDQSQTASFAVGIDDGAQTGYPLFLDALLSGTPQDGVYRWTLLIDDRTPSGSYTTVVSVNDGLGNFLEFSPVFASYPPGLPSSLTLQNAAQETAEIAWMAEQDFSAITGGAAITATGINADPDRDGLSNFFEFHFGTDPADPANVTGAANLPVLSRSGNQLRLDFGTSAGNAALGLPGSSLTGQYSTDLINWIEVPISDTTPGFHRITSPAITGGRGCLRLSAAPLP